MKIRPAKLMIAAGLACVLTACTANEIPAADRAADRAPDKTETLQKIDLAGSEWGFADTNPDDKFIRSVQFQSGGKVTGHGGCNRFFGEYTQTGDAVKIGPLAATKMACPALAEESAFLGALQAAKTAEATHLKLVLRGEDGTTLLSLIRRDWD